jgi:amino-acid N-acetyltransferase
MQNIVIRQANHGDLSWIKSFLEENGLTTVGVDECYRNFVLAIDEKGAQVGVAGFELYNHIALLRSVAVHKSCRNAGYARVLVDTVLKNAKQKGVDTVYLLTEGVEGYFKRLGFNAVKREQIDDAVKMSPEFTECCEHAIVMRKAV